MKGSYPAFLMVLAGLSSTAFLWTGSDQKWGARSMASIDPVFYMADLLAKEDEMQNAATLYQNIFRTSSWQRRLTDLEGDFGGGRARSGQVSDTRVPYSDYWYQEGFGGTNGPWKGEKINGRWTGATYSLEAWDRHYHDGEAKARDWETEHHNDKEHKWYGHCNGFSANVSRHQDPKSPVFRPKGCQEGSAGCIKFERHQIRALMAEIYMNAGSRFIGGHRCDRVKAEVEAANPPQNRNRPEVMDECDDVDPGIFHTALVNWIGIQKQVIVADLTYYNEVWNYPVYRYEFDYEYDGKRLSEQEAMHEVDSSRYNSWVYNPAAKSFVVVKMKMYYAHNRDDIYTGEGKPPIDTRFSPKVYRYILELDEDERILGGEWLGPKGSVTKDSRQNHPDFIWIPFHPRKPSGNRTTGNPFVDPEEVLAMWEESMGWEKGDMYNPSVNPNTILKNPPVDVEKWGVHNDYFTAKLDGGSAGAVFLGKEISLEIERADLLHGNVELTLTHNGTTLAPVKASGNGNLKTTLKPPAGMNYLSFRWKVNGVDQPNSGADFRFYAM